MQTVNVKDIECVVGLSGGIDSAIAAYNLKKTGYKCTGVFMHSWQQDQCPDTSSLQNARDVAAFLEIDFKVIDLSSVYWDKVFSVFLDQLARGYTPNPDLLCNEYVKFAAFREQFGQDKLFATGHYARIEKVGSERALLKGVDPKKDQTYFLARLSQKQLENALFPIGSMHKSDIKKLVNKLNFPNKNAKESMGICFIEQGKLAPFLSKYMLDRPGLIIDSQGNVLGKHKGLFYYTLGQRKGLNLGGKAGFDEKPFYVLSKCLEDNTITVTQNINDPAMLSLTVCCNDVHEIRNPLPIDQTITAKIRHQQSPQSCKIISKTNDKLVVSFEQAQRAVTPGQYIVFYHGDECLGSAMVSYE